MGPDEDLLALLALPGCQEQTIRQHIYRAHKAHHEGADAGRRTAERGSDRQNPASAPNQVVRLPGAGSPHAASPAIPDQIRCSAAPCAA